MTIKEFVDFGREIRYSTSINSHHSSVTGKYELLLWVYDYSLQVGVFINSNNLNSLTEKELVSNLKIEKNNKEKRFLK